MLNRLHSAGYQAFLVGGSVRDMLLGKSPKDFDVSTNATPNQVRSLFRNGRIIGRRFKLVHIIFHRDIVEVATFRSSTTHEAQHTLTNEQGMLIRDNMYGTLDEDAWRRDFTINSLYYNIEDASIIDFTGGVSDIQNRLIRIIGEPEIRYQEDPVRMLRAVRFSAKLHFDIDPKTADPITKLSHLIRDVSNSRLFDELIKLYQCGEAEAVQNLLAKHGLFQQIFPATAELLESEYPVKPFLGLALESTDARIRDNKPINPAFLFAVLLWFPLMHLSKKLQKGQDLPALVALEKAMNQIIAEQCRITTIPKRHSQVIREIWLLQYRFSKRSGERAFALLGHPRFRAAYDFLALRALAGNESLELAQWWTKFQEASIDEQEAMVAKFSSQRKRKKPAND